MKIEIIFIGGLVTVFENVALIDKTTEYLIVTPKGDEEGGIFKNTDIKSFYIED